LSVRPEQFEELSRRVDEALVGCLDETEAEEVRLLLRRWRRINVFFEGFGWIGQHLGRLAVWIAAMWGAFEIIIRIRS